MNTAERTAKDAQAAADRAGQMLADAAPLLDANHKAAAALTAALDRLLPLRCCICNT